MSQYLNRDQPAIRKKGILIGHRNTLSIGIFAGESFEMIGQDFMAYLTSGQDSVIMVAHPDCLRQTNVTVHPPSLLLPCALMMP